jgi:hypothetical protein
MAQQRPKYLRLSAAKLLSPCRRCRQRRAGLLALLGCKGPEMAARLISAIRRRSGANDGCVQLVTLLVRKSAVLQAKSWCRKFVRFAWALDRTYSNGGGPCSGYS